MSGRDASALAAAKQNPNADTSVRRKSGSCMRNTQSKGSADKRRAALSIESGILSSAEDL